MRVVAVGAGHQPLRHRMMRATGKLGAFFQMATQTNVGHAGRSQRTRCTAVYFVTADTGQVCILVFTATPVQPFTGLVTVKATLILYGDGTGGKKLRTVIEHHAG